MKRWGDLPPQRRDALFFNMQSDKYTALAPSTEEHVNKYIKGYTTESGLSTRRGEFTYISKHTQQAFP